MTSGNFIKAFIIAALLPIVSYAILLYLIEWAAALSGNARILEFGFRTQCLIAIIFNLIPFQIFSYRRESEAMRAVMMVTILYAVIWLVYFQFFSGNPIL